MSKGNSHYDNHRRAAELHDIAAHAHNSAAQQHGKQDHRSGQEASRMALEHSNKAYLHSQQIHHAINDQHVATATLAHELWQARGCPEGSPETDWHQAATQLKTGGHK